MNRLFVCSIAALLFSSGARGTCTLDESAIEVQVESCWPATEFAEERLKDQLGWVRFMVSEQLKRDKAVVISGHVLREARVEIVQAGEERLSETRPASRDAFWVLGPKDATCSEAAEGTVHLLLSSGPCCDVFPPSNAACLLEIGYVEPLSDALSPQFGSR